MSTLLSTGFELGASFNFLGISFTGFVTGKGSRAEVHSLAHNREATIKAVAKDINLSEITEKLLNIDLPSEIPDVLIKDLAVSISTEENIHFYALVKLENKALKLGDQEVNIATLEFSYSKSEVAQKITISLMGRDLPKIDQIDAQIKAYNFVFIYNRTQNENGNWHLGGRLHIEAFERLLSFSAEATQIEDSGLISFQAGLQSIVEETYFSDIEGLDYQLLERELLKNKIIVNATEHGLYQLKNDIQIKQIKLSHALSQYREKILLVLEKIKHAGEPVIKIPDLLNGGKTLFSVEPIEFKIQLERKSNTFSKIGFSFSSSLIFYNTWQTHSELLKIENGTLASSFNKESKEFKLIFTAEKSEIKPLNIVGFVTGLPDALHALYNDRAKEKAFMNMLSLYMNEAHFIKKGPDYDIGGSVRLVLNNSLKTVNEDLYAALDAVFPSVGEGDDRFIQGGVSYDSDKGLIFELINNNGLEIPNLFNEALQGIPTKLKEKLKNDINFDLDVAFDYGESYILLEKIRLEIKKEATLTATVAFGLPSKLNDRLFATSSLNGLINTYDKELLKKKLPDVNGQYQDNIPPEDKLTRISLSIGTEGITGQLVKFDLINRDILEKITQGLTCFIIEKDNAVIIDLDILSNSGSTQQTEGQYGKISIDKPKFSLDMENGAFTASGGFEIQSDHLKLPVRSVIERIIALLPLSETTSAVMKKMTEQLTDGISIKSIDFIKDNKLNLHEIENFFKQFLLEKDQSLELVPPAVRDYIEKESANVLKFLPDRFKEYLSIKIPQGLHYKIEVPADKSLSFTLEVPASEENTNSDFSDYLQLLVPDFSMGAPVNWYGIRLKKIGFGTALFNQCFRLDLSVDIDQFNLIQMIAGMGISQLRNINKDEKLNFILPVPEELCQTFEAKNLMVIIFLLKIPAPIPVIPIPVPIFYDRLYLKYRGFDGSGSEFNIEVPAPELNIMQVLKELNSCVQFFNSDDMALPVPSHALVGETGKSNETTSLLRPLEAGPVYIELPGIFGYEKKPESVRKNKIRLGFSNRWEFHALDMIHLSANCLKYSVLSLKDKKLHRIPIDDTDLSEQPVNYLVKYLPAKQRIGSIEIVLFDLFNLNFAWALSTPDEFREVIYPLLIEQQAKDYLPYSSDTGKGASQLLEILPKASSPTIDTSTATSASTPGALKQDEQGIVLFFKGAFKVGELGVDVALGTVLAESTGFATGIVLNAHIANILQMQLWGALKVNTLSEKEKFMLTGTSSFKLWDSYVMKGSFKLAAGSDPLIEFSGLLDLFPDELFPPDKPSLIKFYTGEDRGKKAPIIGRMDKTGILYEGGLHLELGSFYLGGSTRLIVSEKLNMWQMNLSCNTTKITLQAREEKDLLVFCGEANSAIKIGNDISITAASSSGKGPLTAISLIKVNGLPILGGFKFDGAITLLGNSSKTLITINDKGFYLDTKTTIVDISSSLTVFGKNLLDIISYNLSGTLELTKFNNMVELLLDPLGLKKENIRKKEELENVTKIIGETQKKIDFIKEMDSKYNTAKSIDGFDYVVPPTYHIEYWVNLSRQKYNIWNPLHWDKIRQQITYNLSGVKWTPVDVSKVRTYWKYRKDLKLSTTYPPRFNIGRWINGTAEGLVKAVRDLVKHILEDIKNKSNDIHNLLKALKLETKTTQEINELINLTINGLEMLNDEIAQCINEGNMIVRINEIKYNNLSFEKFKSKEFSVEVTVSFLEREPIILNNMDTNMNNPSLLVKSICKAVGACK